MAAEDGQSGSRAPADRVVAGRYALVEELARGGMGVVWVATDLKLDRRVAVKILVTTETDDAVARFEREAKTVAALRSDHVVQVHDYGAEDGIPFIVMELLEGESLGEQLRREGALPLDECADLLVQVARGLRAAHDAGLVHRDLKPSNIFLARRDDGVTVKLLDFGVVKAADRKHGEENTASGVVLGTPQYMSPEQARGIRQVDHRADLWSLGVIMLRAITGQNPFSSDSIGDAVIKICIEPIPKASELVQVPEELDGFFHKALQRDPDQRFQSADAMALAFLDAVGQVEPSAAALGAALRKGLRSEEGAEPSRSVRLAPGPLGDGRSRAAGLRSSQSGALAHTPASATIGATLATSVIRPNPKKQPILAVAAGLAALAVGGIAAFAFLRSGPVPSATPAVASVAVDPSGLPPAGQSDPSGPADATASGSASTTAAPTAASSAVASSASGAPAGTTAPVWRPGHEPTSNRPSGVWVPSEGKQKSGKDAPKWY